MENKIPMLCPDNECTGCSACINSCQFGAITTIQNEDGFYRPSIDADKCTGCHACERRCPILHPLKAQKSQLKVYATWHKDAATRMKSSSGGAFSALAEAILENGGMVIGAAYDEQLHIRHIAISSVEELDQLRRSKYAQSKIGQAFKEIKGYLADGKKVLFVGTPCQVAGLKAFLVKNYDNLFCCDFVCHGVPSSLFFEKYLQWLTSHIGKISSINFRDKRKGWYDSIRVATRVDGKQQILRGNKDSYWVGFNNHDNNLQLSCYNCQFLGLNRLADITIADFWGIGKNKPYGHKDEIEKGVSMVLVNNPQGQALFDLGKGRMHVFERDIDEVVSSNQAISYSSVKPPSRDTFYKDLSTGTFDSMISKYLTPTLKIRLVKIMREYLPYSIVSRIRLGGQR